MEWWHAVILGLVEGITEYLPVSSTGHLILASSLLGLDEPPELKAAVDAFNIVIQGGAILAVLGLYRERVWQMIRGVLGQNPAGLRLAIALFVAFLPAAVFGVLLDEAIEARLFFAGPVLAALALGGIYMIVLDRMRLRTHRIAEADESTQAPPERELEDIGLTRALFIGVLQCIAMWPGTSRSMMTITGGVLAGLSPRKAAEFSFLLGLPTLGGACVYKLYKNVTGEGPNMFEVFGWLPILLGLAVATISAAFAVRWLVGFLNKHGLEPFGWYRLVLAAALGAAVWGGWVSIEPGVEPADETIVTDDAASTSPASTPSATTPTAPTEDRVTTDDRD